MRGNIAMTCFTGERNKAPKVKKGKGKHNEPEPAVQQLNKKLQTANDDYQTLANILVTKCNQLHVAYAKEETLREDLMAKGSEMQRLLKEKQECEALLDISRESERIQKDTISSVERELEHCKASASEQLEAAHIKQDQLEQEVASKVSECAELQRDKREYEVVITTSRENERKLLDTISSSKRELGHWKTSMSEQLQSAYLKEEELRKDLIAKISESEGLLKEKQEYEAMLKNSQENEQKLKDTISADKHKLEYLKESASAQLEEAHIKQDQLERDLAANISERKELLKEKRDQEAVLAASQENERKLLDTISSEKREFELWKAYTNKKLQAADSEEAELRKDLAAKISESEGLRKEKEEFEAILSTSQENEKKLKETISADKQELKYLKEKVDELQKSSNKARSVTPETLVTLQSSSPNHVLGLEKQVQVLTSDLNSCKQQVAALSSLQAKLSGMCVVGDPVHTCASDFAELKDTQLTNLVYDVSSDENTQDVLFDIITKFAFHSFWATILGDAEPKHEAKVGHAKVIGQDQEAIHKCAESIATAVTKAIPPTHASSIDYNIFKDKLIEFYTKCTEWHLKMICCDPPLELLPKNRIPKKDTRLNAIQGLPFELDFGKLGSPLLESVSSPGLIVRDLNGTVFHKAVLKCYFKTK